MADFEIETYTLRTYKSASSPSMIVMYLSSVPAFHGIITWASVFFFETPASSLGFAYNVDQQNLQGHYIAARTTKDDFEFYYRTLQSEKPLRFSYTYSPTGSIRAIRRGHSHLSR